MPDVYNFFHMGGNLERPLYGYIPLEIFLSFIIGNEIKVMTIMSLITCLLSGYFAQRAICVLNSSVGHIQTLLVFLTVSFLPLAAWRVANGHLNFLFGINLFFLNIYFISSLINKKLTKNIYIVYFMCAFNFFAQIPGVAQISLYLCLFFLPIYCYLLLNKEYRKQILSLFLLIAFVLLIHFDQLFIFIKLMMSGEIARGSAVAIYSYLDRNISYTLSSFLTSNSGLEFFGFPPAILHEINYPVGVGTLFLFVCSLKGQNRKLTVYLILFMFISFLYATGSLGTYDIFRSLPVLNMFRVPTRIYIIASGFISFMVLYFLSKDHLDICKRKSFGILFALFPIIYVDTFYLEILLLVLVTCALFIKSKYLRLSTFVVFFFVNYSSFKEKILFLKFNPDVHKVYKKASSSHLSNDVFENGVAAYIDKYQNFNTANFYGLPSLEGYNFPLKSFLDTYANLTGTEVSYTAVTIRNVIHPNYLSLNNLYNVNVVLDLSDKDKPIKKTFIAKSRSPQNVHTFKTEQEVFQFMRSNYKNYDFLQDNVAIVGREIKGIKKCYYKKNELDRNLSFNLTKNSSFPCIIVLPYNYSSFLEINTQAELLKVDNTLIGIYFDKKPSIGNIIISPRYDFGIYILIKCFIWGSLCLIIPFMRFYDKKTFAAQSPVTNRD